MKWKWCVQSDGGAIAEHDGVVLSTSRFEYENGSVQWRATAFHRSASPYATRPAKGPVHARRVAIQLAHEIWKKLGRT